MIDTTQGFTMVRMLDATPAEIWRAWTDPDEIAAWWHPHGMTTPRDSVAVDATVGGTYRYTMVDDLSGQSYETGGVYRELVENQKLVFTWGYPDGNQDENPLVTVTIEDLGELTRLTFDLRGVDGTKGDNNFYDGWDSALDELVGHLGQNDVLG